MDLVTALIADVARLVEHLNLDPGSIVEPLAGLTEDLSAAAPSFTGLQLAIGPEDYPVVLTAFPTESAPRSRSSLTVPLSALELQGDGEITFFAGRAGALVDLAADLRYVLKVPDDVLLLDRRSAPDPPVSGVTGLAERSSVDRALGILIERGSRPGDALAQLGRLAAEHRIAVPLAAGLVLASVRGGRAP